MNNVSKIGFQIVFQKDLSVEEILEAKEYADSFIVKTLSDPKKRYFGVKGGGYDSGLWRNRYGLEVGTSLVFRRISKNRRVFGIVRRDCLEVSSDKFLNKTHREFRDLEPDGPVPNGCQCPKHKGSLKVKFKLPLEIIVYAQIGDIKG